MKSRAFIGYLVNYDFTNISRIWDSEKNNVNDYKNVILDENQFFDSNEKKDLIKKAKQSEFVEFQISAAWPTI